MPVVRHQAVSQHTHRHLLMGLFKGLFEGGVVVLAAADLKTRIGPVEDVINEPAGRGSRHPWHSFPRYPPKTNVSRKGMRPQFFRNPPDVVPSFGAQGGVCALGSKLMIGTSGRVGRCGRR